MCIRDRYNPWSGFINIGTFTFMERCTSLAPRMPERVYAPVPCYANHVKLPAPCYAKQMNTPVPCYVQQLEVLTPLYIEGVGALVHWGAERVDLPRTVWIIYHFMIIFPHVHCPAWSLAPANFSSDLECFLKRELVPLSLSLALFSIFSGDTRSSTTVQFLAWPPSTCRSLFIMVSSL